MGFEIEQILSFGLREKKLTRFPYILNLFVVKTFAYFLVLIVVKSILFGEKWWNLDFINLTSLSNFDVVNEFSFLHRGITNCARRLDV